MVLSRPAEATDAYRAALELDDQVHRLSWVNGSGAILWRADLETAGEGLRKASRSLAESGRTEEARSVLARLLSLGVEGESSGKLTAPIWYPALPSLEIEWLEQEPLSSVELAGKVMLLEFWATWCRPCLEQLPQAQALYDAEKGRGLVAIAINAMEPVDAALRYARALKLTMPLGRYASELERSFKVRTLPTVIVVDRRGRIRARWDGQAAGGPEQISGLVRRLLEETEEPREELAEVLFGEGLLLASWTRELPATIEGIATGTAMGAEPVIWVSAGRSLWTYAADARPIADPREIPLGGRLRSTDIDRDGRPELLVFRRADTRVVGLESSMTGLEIRSPSALLDVELLPRSGTEGGSDVLLASAGGLLRADGTGRAPTPLGDLGTVSDLVRLEGDGRLMALETGRALHSLDRDLNVQRRLSIPADGAVLVAAPGIEGAGIAPSAVVSAVTGRFLGGASYQAALATAGGQLLLVDIGSGGLLFRARWENLAHLATIDVESDGIDELLAVSGRRLSLVRAATPP